MYNFPKTKVTNKVHEKKVHRRYFFNDTTINLYYFFVYTILGFYEFKRQKYKFT